MPSNPIKRKAPKAQQATPTGNGSIIELTSKKRFKKAKSDDSTVKAKLHDTFALETTLNRSKAKSETSDIEDEQPSSPKEEKANNINNNDDETFEEKASNRTMKSIN